MGKIFEIVSLIVGMFINFELGVFAWLYYDEMIAQWLFVWTWQIYVAMSCENITRALQDLHCRRSCYVCRLESTDDDNIIWLQSCSFVPAYLLFQSIEL